MAIPPISEIRSAEWSIPPIDTPTPAKGGGFGAMLAEQINGLATTQAEAATQAQALATGQATDPTSVVMAVERAQLAMQLASQVRNKSVEAVQTIFSTQV